MQLPTFKNVQEDSDLQTPISVSLLNSRNVEAIGFWFHRSRALDGDLRDNRFFNSSEANNDNEDKGDDSAGRERDTGDSRKFVKLSEEDLETDWYAFLKVSAGEGATEGEIRTAYKKRCLETHPDKQPNRSDVEFKRVQRAFEILGCPSTRRAYDSSRPFDDTIPTEDTIKDDDAFFSIYKPVFDRNRKWSTDSKIPSLGSLTTSIKEVNRFYDAWYRFSSWRDFSHEVELEEIDDGMCREEKRFYQRENQRLLDRCKRNDLKRIRTLVERAQKLDPRLRKVREEQAAAKEKDRAERAAERERIHQEEVMRKAAIAEKEKAELAARQEAVLMEKRRIRDAASAMEAFLEEKKLLDKTPSNLILPSAVRLNNVSWIFGKIKTGDEAEALLKAVTAATTESDGDIIPAVVVFNTAVESKEIEIGVTRYGEPCKKQVSKEELSRRKQAEEEKKLAAAKAASGTVWSDDDVVALQKAIAKYPGGTVDRWRKMAQMLHDKFTEDEVLAKTKELEAQLRQGGRPTAVVAPAGAPAVEDPDAWTPEQQKQLENGLRDLKDYKEKDKYQKVAKFVTGKTAKQCFDRFKFLCTLNKAKK